MKLSLIFFAGMLAATIACAPAVKESIASKCEQPQQIPQIKQPRPLTHKEVCAKIAALEAVYNKPAVKESVTPKCECSCSCCKSCKDGTDCACKTCKCCKSCPGKSQKE